MGYETLVSPAAFLAQGMRLWSLLAHCIMKHFPVWICRVGGMPRRVKSVPEPRRGGGILLSHVFGNLVRGAQPTRFQPDSNPPPTPPRYYRQRTTLQHDDDDDAAAPCPRRCHAGRLASRCPSAPSSRRGACSALAAVGCSVLSLSLLMLLLYNLGF